MATCGSHHRGREVGAVAGVGDQVDVGSQHAAFVVIADIPAVVEAVPAAGDEEVVVTVHAHLDGPLQLQRRNSGHAGEQRRLALLATKAAAHAPALHHHAMRRPAERMRHQLLHLARVLGGAMHQQAFAAFLRHGQADLALQVELLLPAQAPLALQAVWRARELLGRLAAREVHGRQHVLAGRMGLQRGNDGGQGFGSDDLLGQGGRAAGQFPVGRDDGEHRLADVAQLVARQDGVVMEQRAAVVLGRDVRRGQHRDHAGLAAQGVEVDVEELAVRQWRQAECCMQGAGRFRQIVGVRRGAADMQMRRLMRA
jgi:hypothetical protein